MDHGAQGSGEKQSPIQQIAAFIVDKRKAFYLIYIGFAIFCVFSSGWVAVNDDLTSYLPDTTETRQGLTIMEEEFVTFGTSRIMVDNISYDQAERLAEQAEALPGVKSVEFDGTESNGEIGKKTGAAIRKLTRDCGVKTLEEMGFDRDIIVGGAAYVASNALTYNCPIPMDETIAARILASAYDDYR